MSVCERVCVSVRERERERESVCVCVRKRESVCVCVRVMCMSSYGDIKFRQLAYSILNLYREPKSIIILGLHGRHDPDSIFLRFIALEVQPLGCRASR